MLAVDVSKAIDADTSPLQSRYLERLLDNSRIRQLADCQLADWTTHRLNISWTGHLADWSTRILDKLWTGQLGDATGDFACLVFVVLAASARPRVVQSATCPVLELSSPRVDQSARCPVRELAVCELVYPCVVQLPLVSSESFCESLCRLEDVDKQWLWVFAGETATSGAQRCISRRRAEGRSRSRGAESRVLCVGAWGAGVTSEPGQRHADAKWTAARRIPRTNIWIRQLWEKIWGQYLR